MKDEEAHRKPDILDLDKVNQALRNGGFGVGGLEQFWRHVTGRVKKDGKEYFIKIAANDAVAERTRNEVTWNEQISKLTKLRDIFYVPPILDTGKLMGRFYYLTEFVEGRAVATKNPPDLSRLEFWLKKIVLANLYLLQLTGLKFRRDKSQENFVKDPRDYVSKTRSWMKEVGDPKLASLMSVIEGIVGTYEPSINHGDFVPWHMFDNSTYFTLIDGEAASSLSPRYYDIAYFYRAVYTSGKSPELAKKHLNLVRDSLPPDDRDGFVESVVPLIAARIMAGYRDAKIDKNKDTKYLDLAMKDVLNGNIF